MRAMNRVPISLGLALALVVTGLALCAGEPQPEAAPPKPTAKAASGSGPRIQFATPVFDFAKATPGQSVKYSFIFTNTGNQPLEISAVRPGCGCTTAGKWTRRVEAGRTGAIPLQLDVADTWPSGPIAKTVTVDCNDPSQPWVVLQIQGTVWKPIDVAPMLAAFNLVADSAAASTSVRIINNTEAPIVLAAPEVNNRAFSVVLKTNQAGKEFELVVTARPPFSPGPIQGEIKLKRPARDLQEIRVPVYANVQPVIEVMPPQITLRAGATGRSLNPTITIQNNSTRHLELSDPVVNDKNVAIQIKEAQPGHSFAVTLAFPPDFKIPEGQHRAFTVKTSHPQFPVIEVPIVLLRLH